jgi:L-ascorbate metabolism protein UlaG (beta-lactamase superfamily)
MRITKFGHCCLLIEENGLRILTDPGGWNTVPPDLSGIDMILITHEHGDHLHVETIKKILKMNPGVAVVGNKGVEALLQKEGIACVPLGDGNSETFKGVLISGHGTEHALIHPVAPKVENTGFFIAKRFFYPGDSFCLPPSDAEILALPVAGPWMKLTEATDYVKALKPKASFPVHDGMLASQDWLHQVVAFICKQEGVAFEPLANGGTREW